MDLPSSVPPTVPASSGAVAHVEVSQGDSGRVRVADVVAEVVSRRSGESQATVMFWWSHEANRFAFLSESDIESDNEPLVRLTGRRSEDDVITISASSGAV